jgi:hypothetical protein
MSYEAHSSDLPLSWELLDRYYAGEATVDEATAIRAHFADRPEASIIINSLVDTLHKGMSPPSIEVATMLSAAHERMLPHTVLRNVVRTFFDGSFERAVAALLDVSRVELTDAELADLRLSIRRTKQEGR